MSKFRALVEGILKEKGIYDLERDEYYGDPDDHTTSDEEIEWTLDLPMNDEIRQKIIDANIASKEDLQDNSGNWWPTGQFDVIIVYDIDGYPDDEYITVTGIYLEDYDSEKHKYFKGDDITSFLPEEYLQKVADKLENSGYIDLHSYDYEGEWRKDYYSSVL